MKTSLFLEKPLFPAHQKKGWPWKLEITKQAPEPNNINSWPKISIITPSFNQGLFLEETIRSVLLQGYPNLEYIIIDGGSTDNSLEIIKKYERWVSYWVSEKDNGQTHAINKGLRLATGDILAWINSDDFYQPNCFFDVINSLPISKPAWIQASCKIITEDHQLLYYKNLKNSDIDYKLFINWLNHWIPQQSTFWNRQIQNQIGYLNEDLNYVMDVDFIYRLSQFISPIIIDNVLSNYRMQPKAKSIDQAEDSKIELFDWIDRTILKDEKIGHESRLYLINEIFRLENEKKIEVSKLTNIKNHIFIGKLITWWKQYINCDLDI